MFKVSITLQMWNLTSIRSYLCTGVHHHSGWEWQQSRVWHHIWYFTRHPGKHTQGYKGGSSSGKGQRCWFKWTGEGFFKQQKIMKDLLCVALNIISFTLRFTALNSWQRAKKTLLPKYGALFFHFLVPNTSWIKLVCFPGISKVNVTFITCVSLILGCVSLNLALVLQIFTSSDCNTRSQIKLISVSHRLS